MKKYFINRGVWILILIFFCAYSLLAVTKYQHYQTGLDLAIYVQTIWFYTHIKAPLVTLFPTFGDLVWVDHFSPSLILLTPLYLIWKDPRILLLFQSFFICIGAYPLFLLSRKYIHSVSVSYAIVVTFLTSFMIQYPIQFDFHLATTAASFLPWIFWTMEEKKWKVFVLLCILMAGVKEDAPFYVAACGLYLVTTRQKNILGILLCIGALMYEYIIVHFIMPGIQHVSPKTYFYPYISFTPSFIVSVFLNSPVKIRTILLSFGNLLLIPLFSGTFLLFPLIHFFINFVSNDFPGRWDIYLQYRSYLAPIMIVGFIKGYEKAVPSVEMVIKRKIPSGCIAILLICTAGIFDIALHLPLNTLSKKQFYYQESWIHDNDEVRSHIPSDARLATMNSLAPQTAYRQFISFYPANIKNVDYIFLDVRTQQPITNFWLTAESEAGFEDKIEKLSKSQAFTIVYRVHDSVLWKRNAGIPVEEILK